MPKAGELLGTLLGQRAWGQTLETSNGPWHSSVLSLQLWAPGRGQRVPWAALPALGWSWSRFSRALLQEEVAWLGRCPLGEDTVQPPPAYTVS